MRDLKQDIQDILISEPDLSVNMLHKRLGSPNKTRFTNDWKALEKEGILLSHRDHNDFRFIRLSLVNPNERLSKFIDSFIPNLKWIEKNAEKHLKQLKKLKPIAKEIEPVKGRMTKFVVDKKQHAYVPRPSKEVTTIGYNWKIKEGAKQSFDELFQLLNNLFIQSSSLTYAQVLGDIPKTYDKKIRQYQKLCIDTITKIVTKLYQQDPESRPAIWSYLPYKLNGFQLVSKLATIAQKNKK